MYIYTHGYTAGNSQTNYILLRVHFNLFFFFFCTSKIFIHNYIIIKDKVRTPTIFDFQIFNITILIYYSTKKFDKD